MYTREEAGIRPSQRSKKVGDCVLEEVLFAGPLYQDCLARHASLPKDKRRVDWQTAAFESLTMGTTHEGLSGTSHLDPLVEDAAGKSSTPGFF